MGMVWITPRVSSAGTNSLICYKQTSVISTNHVFKFNTFFFFFELISLPIFLSFWVGLSGIYFYLRTRSSVVISVCLLSYTDQKVPIFFAFPPGKGITYLVNLLCKHSIIKIFRMCRFRIKNVLHEKKIDILKLNVFIIFI